MTFKFNRFLKFYDSEWHISGSTIICIDKRSLLFKRKLTMRSQSAWNIESLKQNFFTGSVKQKERKR